MSVVKNQRMTKGFCLDVVSLIFFYNTEQFLVNSIGFQKTIFNLSSFLFHWCSTEKNGLSLAEFFWGY